jgi:hypothetical protein
MVLVLLAHHKVKALFGTQELKNVGIGKMQELRCHVS